MRSSPAAGGASALRYAAALSEPGLPSPCSAATAQRWTKPSHPARRISLQWPTSPMQASVKSAIAEAAARQPIDILIANAGAAESAPFGRSDAALFQRMMDVNFMGVVHATQAVLPAMVERRHGRIVAVASTAGLKGYAYVWAYSAAKHAVIGLVRSLALETAKSGVTVNAVCPGFTETDLLEGSIDNIIKKTGRSREQAIAELSKHNPQGRLVAPSEVADAVLWLCGEGAGAITGQAIAVAGGEV